MFKPLISHFAVLLALCLPAVITHAQPISNDQLEQLLDRLGETIVDNYVEIDLANSISADLNTSSNKVEFRNARSPEALAALLTDFLRQYDGHFSVSWQNPAQQAPSNQESEAQRQARFSAQLAALRRQNYGFQELRIMEGNLGYLKLSQFSDANISEAAQAGISAMNFLASSDAVIIDLRQNGGGDPNMVQLLSSYLFPPETYLNALYYRPTDETQQYWTYANVDGRRFTETPIYVLISGRTGSAAEEFAYNLKTRERATLVGQTTAGAANPGGVFPIMHGYSAFISTGKAINPITGTNWEGTGVKPDVEVPANDALDWAIDDALAKLANITEEQQHKRELDWAIEARQNRRILTDGEARQYTGQFSGQRTIQLIDGQLFYVRSNRPPQVMLAIADDRFILKGINGFRLTFQRDDNGQINGLTENWVFGLTRPWPKQ